MDDLPVTIGDRKQDPMHDFEAPHDDAPNDDAPQDDAPQDAAPREGDETRAAPPAQSLTPEERARLIAEASELLGGGTPLTPEELAEDPYINYRF